MRARRSPLLLPCSILLAAACVEDIGLEAECGNGTVDSGEACDEGTAGNLASSTACTPLCTVPGCGDGFVASREECDEGAANDDHGATCTSSCRFPTCGDGLVQPGEECDGEGPGGCNANCTVPGCGDGVVGLDEECDAAGANDDLNGSCTASCARARCGEGIVQSWEACDGGPGCNERCVPGDAPCGAAELWLGEHTAFVRRTDGAVLGFGLNQYGALGFVSEDRVGVPTEVPGGPFVAVAAGDRFTVAIDGAGKLWSWGENDSGQRGTGDFAAHPEPTRVVEPPGAEGASYRSVSAGRGIAYAIDAGGTLRAFGRNDQGQLGASMGAGELCPVGTCAPVPVQVGGDRWLQVVAGADHALAIRDDGTLWAWGNNAQQQLGVSRENDVSCLGRPCKATPVQVEAIPRVKQLGAGAGYSLVLAQDGRLWGFGNNPYGNLGVAAPTESPPAPVPLDSLEQLPGERIEQLAAGRHFFGMLSTTGGALITFGWNGLGALGRTELADSLPPAPVALPGPVRSIAAGYDFSAVILEDGRPFFFGNARYGQLGDGTTLPEEAPRPEPQELAICP